MVFVAATGTPLSRTSMMSSIAPSCTLYSRVAGLLSRGETLKHSPNVRGINSFLLIDAPPSLVSDIGVLRRCSLSLILIFNVSAERLSMSSIVPLNIVTKSARSQRTSPTKILIDLLTQISDNQLSKAPLRLCSSMSPKLIDGEPSRLNRSTSCTDSAATIGSYTRLATLSMYSLVDK